MNRPEEPQIPRNDAPFGILVSFLWMLGAMLCVILFIGFVHSLLPDIGRDLVSLGALSALVFLALTAHLLSRHPGGERLTEAVGMRRAHPLVLILSGLIGVSLRGPAEGLRKWSTGLFEVGEQTQTALQEMVAIHSGQHAVFMMVSMALLVPLGEEVFFRGGVYGAMRRSGSTALRAAAITTIGFALSHPQALLPVSLVAAVLGLLRASSGSLLPSLSAHIAFNAIEVLEMSTTWVPELDSVLIVELSFSLLALLLVFSFFVWRDPAAKRGRLLESGDQSSMETSY